MMSQIKNILSKLTFLCTSIILFYSQNVTASDDVEKAGDVLRIVLPSIAFSSTFFLDDNDGRKQLYKAFFTNLGVTYGLKAMIEKERPNKEDADSFPSAHTSVSFQSAAFIHKRYGLKYAIPAYFAASYVGYSRVESDNHYTEDVFAGAAIGIASSLYFIKPYKGFTITPKASNGTYGLNISKRW